MKDKSKQTRERSPSVKRKNPGDEENKEPFKTVGRKPRKSANGTSQVGLEDIAPGGLAGPVDFYIGNTEKRVDEDIIKWVLKKCAEAIEGSENFEVMEVELLTLEANPRTKCWRVSVPYQFKTLMENDGLYPPGWKHRKFFGSRKRKENQAKKGRTEDPNQVDQMIKERERESEALAKKNKEELLLQEGGHFSDQHQGDHGAVGGGPGLNLTHS